VDICLLAVFRGLLSPPRTLRVFKDWKFSSFPVVVFAENLPPLFLLREPFYHLPSQVGLTREFKLVVNSSPPPSTQRPFGTAGWLLFIGLFFSSDRRFFISSEGFFFVLCEDQRKSPPLGETQEFLLLPCVFCETAPGRERPLSRDRRGLQPLKTFFGVLNCGIPPAFATKEHSFHDPRVLVFCLSCFPERGPSNLNQSEKAAEGFLFLYSKTTRSARPLWTRIFAPPKAFFPLT